jgi:hypothetical protein
MQVLMKVVIINNSNVVIQIGVIVRVVVVHVVDNTAVDVCVCFVCACVCFGFDWILFFDIFWRLALSLFFSVYVVVFDHLIVVNVFFACFSLYIKCCCFAISLLYAYYV